MGKQQKKEVNGEKNSGVVLHPRLQYNTHKETINQCKMTQQQNK